jgi:hypothetical protein
METELNFKIQRSFAYSGGDQNGEPIGIHIIKSGWRNPDLYHIIIEHGDTEMQDHFLMSAEHIQENFSIFLDQEEDLGKLIFDNPNDQELGKAIRLHYLKNLK